MTSALIRAHTALVQSSALHRLMGCNLGRSLKSLGFWWTQGYLARLHVNGGSVLVGQKQFRMLLPFKLEHIEGPASLIGEIMVVICLALRDLSYPIHVLLAPHASSHCH